MFVKQSRHGPGSASLVLIAAMLLDRRGDRLLGHLHDRVRARSSLPRGWRWCSPPCCCGGAAPRGWGTADSRGGLRARRDRPADLFLRVLSQAVPFGSWGWMLAPLLALPLGALGVLLDVRADQERPRGHGSDRRASSTTCRSPRRSASKLSTLPRRRRSCSSATCPTRSRSASRTAGPTSSPSILAAAAADPSRQNGGIVRRGIPAPATFGPTPPVSPARSARRSPAASLRPRPHRDRAAARAVVAPRAAAGVGGGGGGW